MQGELLQSNRDFMTANLRELWWKLSEYDTKSWKSWTKSYIYIQADHQTQLQDSIFIFTSTVTEVNDAQIQSAGVLKVFFAAL